MKIEFNKTYQLYNIEGQPIFWLYAIESFLWCKSYVVQLRINNEHVIRTLRFKHHPTKEDVANLYIDRYLKKKFI